MLEGQHYGPEHTVAQTVQLVMRQAKGVGHLVGRRQLATVVGELLLDLFQLAAERANGARRPISGADRIEDRATNTTGGEAVEGNTAGVVVAASRLDEAQGTCPGEFLTIDIPREPHGDL